MELLVNKINELEKEARDLVSKRSRLENEIQSIDTRLTQIVGAITELNKLVNGEEDGGDKTGESGEREFQESTTESEQREAADGDSEKNSKDNAEDRPGS